jgi:hypothetical protein
MPTTDEEPTDTIESHLSAFYRNRVASMACPVPGEETMEARLVTFGGGYAFLTDTYQAKLATHLLSETAGCEEAEIESVPARLLRPGDLLLFLRGSDRDVIRQQADELLPGDERERAGMWRQALHNYQEHQKCTVEMVWERLRHHGCPLTLQAITNWFIDANIISPLNIDRELNAILSLTQDPQLLEGLSACKLSIRRVRSAHQRASHLLAKRVMERAVAGLQKANSVSDSIDIGEGIVLASVCEIDEEPIQVRNSAVNRFMEGDTWLE